MSDAVMVPRERLIEIIGGEVCVMADHGDSIDPSSVEDAADAILKAFAASTPVGGWEEQLAGRDAFIVRKGLWSEFVDSLPPPPSVSIDNGSSPDGDTHRVPDGWVLVPKEPTTAMLQGACDKHTPGVPMSEDRPYECPRFEARRRVWERMVAGSQATPQPADGCSSNEGADIECPSCEGSGKIVEAATTTGANQHSACQHDCEDCGGSGRILPQTEKGS